MVLAGVILDAHIELVPAGGQVIESLMVSFCVPLGKVPHDLVGRPVDIEVSEDGTITAISLVEQE